MNKTQILEAKVECACGCGVLIQKYDKRGRIRKWVVGHWILGKSCPDRAILMRKRWANGSLKPNCREKHWNWRGGITPFNLFLRHDIKYKEWKLAVYARDKGICQECGRRCRNNDIIAHHRKPFNDYPELRYKVDNGIVLCRSCHFKIERQMPRTLKLIW